MPLYKRKPFPLAGRPEDLKPQQLVFQVRFTKEIFRDYGEYLNRINLYRQRVWTCKVSGKTNLTFEEALVSEKKATEKVQQFPGELVGPVLRDVQFSMLTLRDLANTIAKKLQVPLSEGMELFGKRNSRACPCKIVKVLDVAGRAEYEVAWLDKDKKMIANAVVNEEDLIQRKLPFTRDVLKSFIRESTYRSVPWVIHDKLARKHGISSDPPENLKDILSLKDGRANSNRKRSKTEDGRQENGEFRSCKRKRAVKGKMEALGSEEEIGGLKKEPIKYPIDDLMVQPSAHDPVFPERPSPSSDFNVLMDSVGDLLMVWDFCSSFSRLLHLWPFSLEDFENAFCHKDSNVVLIAETHAALLRLLMKDNEDYSMVTQKKKRKPKITLITWTEYLCNFLEVADNPKLSKFITTIRRGHYGLLDIHAKLGILGELVTQVLITDTFREKLDEYMEQCRALAAARREEALEEGRKKREEKERLKAEPDGKKAVGCILESVGSSLNDLMNHRMQNGDAEGKWNEDSLTNQGKPILCKRQKVETTSKDLNEQKIDPKAASGNRKDLSSKGSLKLMNDNGKEAVGKSEEQRKDYLEREMEKRFIRTTSLGKDRYYNRYWFFRRDGRVFAESSDSKQWGYYSTKDELDAFIGSLNQKGERERALKKQLEKYYDRICLGIQKGSKEVVNKIEMEEAVLRRSTRVRATLDNPAFAFLKYINKWRED